jgi:hypothetical protein
MVAMLPATAALRAVAMLPATAALPTVSMLPATAALRVVATLVGGRSRSTNREMRGTDLMAAVSPTSRGKSMSREIRN